MECSYPESTGSVFQESHGLLTPAAAAILLTQVELVDESISAEPFETVAEAEYRVADRRIAVENEPGTAEVGILQQRDESGTRLLAIVTVAVESVVRLHEVKKQFGVGRFGDMELRTVGHGF